MTLTAPRPAPGPAPRPAAAGSLLGASRDPVVDLVRALCLIAVVGLHALMVGVSVSGGVPVLENALEGWPGFTVFSWFTQMMPLFFILGGFASATHLRRLRARGVRPADYVAARLRRLLPVPLAAAAVTVVVLIALAAGGVPGELVATAGWRISQPLWFLGVYILCSALVPVMLRAHERAPRLALLGLALAILSVDGLRAATGVDAIGFANLLFVWLGVQQLGFWLADGRAPSLRQAGGALAVIVVLVLIGASPANLFDALNPPTAALALLGVVQVALFAAVRGRLAVWAAHPSARTVSDVINSRAMTIYAWHMPVVVLLGGALVALATWTPEVVLPTPLSGEWWLSRPVWLGGAALAVAVVVRAVGGLERGARSGVGPAPMTGPRAATAVLVSAGGVLVILAATGAPWAWAAGAFLMVVGLRIVTERTRSSRRDTIRTVRSVFVRADRIRSAGVSPAAGVSARARGPEPRSARRRSRSRAAHRTRAPRGS